MTPGTLLERYSMAEIAKIKRAGEILARTLAIVKKEAVPGLTTAKLDEMIDKIIRSYNAKPAFLGYKVGKLRFAHSACISLNAEVVHGIPGARILREGDLLKVDIGVEKDGYFADAAITVPIGEVDAEATRLMEVTAASLANGLASCTPGKRIGDIGAAVQRTAEAAGYGVVRDLSGHGIGRKLHQEPPVPNTGRVGTGLPLVPGLVLAVEPMINQGTHKVRTQADGWTVVTGDGRLSAHMEHTVAVTENGPLILTDLES